MQMNECGNYTKRCRVCGDTALGFNFNGLSCESCKAFFRRNAFKQTLKCKKVGNCQVEMSNRKYCKLCRLNKCFKIGMKKELIVLYNSKDAKKKESTPLPSNPLRPLEISRLPIIYSNELPASERQRLAEVQDAMRKEFCDARKLPVTGTVEVMNDGMNLAGYYVKNICKFCKHIPAFRCLPVNDQINVLKPFFFDILAAVYAFSYNAKLDGFPIAENEKHDSAKIFPLRILDQWKKQDIVPIFRKYHSSVSREMENDTAIRDLVIAQCLFSKENTSCTEFMRYQYAVYNRLLKLYLFHKYKNVDKVERKYSILMGILKDGEEIRKIIEDIYAAIEVGKLQPVIAEVYNLN